MPVGLLMLDEDNTIHYANGAAASILGERPCDLIGTTFASRAADGEPIEALDFATGEQGSVWQPEGVAAGSARKRIVMLMHRGKASLGEAAAAGLDESAGAAVAELTATRGTEAAAARLRHAVGGTGEFAQGLPAAGPGQRQGQEQERRGPLDFRACTESVAEREAAAPRRTLVVDDDGAVARITARALAVVGIEAIAPDSVDGALSYLETDPVDSVLVDAMMPGPGIEHVCREIRRLQPEARVIVMSGADTVAELVRDLADYFLAKPFSVAELRSLFDERAPQRLRRAA